MLEIPEHTKKFTKFNRLALFIISAVFFVLLYVFIFATNNDKVFLNLGTVYRAEFIAKVPGFGRLRARNSFSVVSKVNGTIKEIVAFPGEVISKGMPLLTLLNPDLNRNVEIAELELLKAKSIFESASSELILNEVALENEVEISKSNLRFANEELAKLSALVEQQIVSELDYLRAKTNLELSELRVKLAQRNLATFLSIRHTKIRANELALESANHDLRLAKEDLANLTVRAESSGVLSEIGENVKQGQTMSKGQMVATVIDKDSLFASILVTASQANQIVPGQQANIRINNSQIPATVKRIFPTVTNNQVTVELEAMGNIADSVRENLDVAGEIITSKKSSALVLDRPKGVVRAFSELELFVVRGDYLVKTLVQIGEISSQSIELIYGLEEGDQVLLEVPQHLRDRKRLSMDELRE